MKSGADIQCANWNIASPDNVSFYGSRQGAHSEFYGRAEGSSAITALSASGKTGSALIVVRPYQVEVLPSTVTLAPEQSRTFTVSLRDDKGVSVPKPLPPRYRWEAEPSDGVSIAPIPDINAANLSAVIIAKKPGITKVTVTLQAEISGAPAPTVYGRGVATITVLDPLNVTSTMASFTVREGQSVSIPYSARTSTGTPVTDGVTTTAVTGGCAVINTGSIAVTVQGNIAGPCSLTITVTKNGVAGSVTVPGTVTGLTPADLIGSYTKLGSREATCSPSAFGENFTVTLNVIADGSSPSGVRLEEVHPTVTLPWSFVTATPITGGLRLVTGTPTRSIGGRNYVTYLEAEFIGGTYRGFETFNLVGTTCTERYAITGTRQ